MGRPQQEGTPRLLRSPGSWQIVLLPYFGGVLYLFFGINRVERRKWQRRKAVRESASAKDRPRIAKYEISGPRGVPPIHSGRLSICSKNCESPG